MPAVLHPRREAQSCKQGRQGPTVATSQMCLGGREVEGAKGRGAGDEEVQGVQSESQQQVTNPP